jgi:hypothetical protein
MKNLWSFESGVTLPISPTSYTAFSLGEPEMIRCVCMYVCLCVYIVYNSPTSPSLYTAFSLSQPAMIRHVCMFLCMFYVATPHHRPLIRFFSGRAWVDTTCMYACVLPMYTHMNDRTEERTHTLCIQSYVSVYTHIHYMYACHICTNIRTYTALLYTWFAIRACLYMSVCI